jgi:hypothetical protein
MTTQAPAKTWPDLRAKHRLTGEWVVACISYPSTLKTATYYRIDSAAGCRLEDYDVYEVRMVNDPDSRHFTPIRKLRALPHHYS